MPLTEVGQQPAAQQPAATHLLTTRAASLVWQQLIDCEPPASAPCTVLQVRLVNIKLITLTELKLITDRGAEGRRKLSELLEGDGRLVSSITRESVI